jgi:uncharacterized membrane-anchored protein
MVKRYACLMIASAFVLSGLVVGVSGAQEGPRLNFQSGPATFPMGEDLAEIDLSENYVFLDRKDTVRLLELTQNPESGREKGTVLPISDAEDWFVVFEFDDIGYVPDEDSELDADELLASFREGTRASNETRKEMGWPTMEIVGWHDSPRYDPVTKNLTWAIVGASEGVQSINRIVKVLGRRGVMTLTLVASAEELDMADYQLAKLIDNYRFQSGGTYAEYLPGTDKLAEVGLAALVVGGAGAALVKSGILARFWKFILVAVAGAGAAIKRLFTGRRAEDEPITRA